jgi:hypothetical protein
MKILHVKNISKEPIAITGFPVIAPGQIVKMAEANANVLLANPFLKLCVEAEEEKKEKKK